MLVPPSRDTQVVAFGAEARAFQKRHRSERLRTMTLVAEAEKLTAFRPVCGMEP